MTYSIKHIGGVFTYEGYPIADQGWIKNVIWDFQNPYSRQGIENWKPNDGNEFQVELSGRWEKQTGPTWIPGEPGRWEPPYVMLFIEAASTEDCSAAAQDQHPEEEQIAHEGEWCVWIENGKLEQVRLTRYVELGTSLRKATQAEIDKHLGTETREDYPVIEQEPQYGKEAITHEQIEAKQKIEELAMPLVRTGFELALIEIEHCIAGLGYNREFEVITERIKQLREVKHRFNYTIFNTESKILETAESQEELLDELIVLFNTHQYDEFEEKALSKFTIHKKV